MSFISIIIPCYNAEKHIDRAINSILSQIGDINYEIIVVNDGSIDDTASKVLDLSTHEERLIYIEQSNGGVSSARNLGLSKAKGDYIYFLDADDKVHPETLLSVQRLLPADVVLFGFEHIHVGGTACRYIPMFSEDYLRDFLRKDLRVHICSAVFNRQFLIDTHICFSGDIYYGEDGEFIRKALFHAQTVHIIPLVLFSYIGNPASVINVPYSSKRLTSLYAMPRSCQEFKGTRYESDITFAFNVSILYNYANYLKSSPDRALDEDFKGYLSMLSTSFYLLKFNKYGLAVALLICLKKVSRRLFEFLLRRFIK